jgi:site-specific DNA-methyltransferase (adenine-specific)
MATHPYQFLPDLLPEEYEALKASIAERGVEVPVVIDQDGETVDGFHRERATDELGIFCPKEIREFSNAAEKFELALRLNCRRRQLNREQKRELIAAYLQRDPQIADNHLAEIIGGISKNTVAEIRSQLEATRQIDKFDVLRGKDGKDRPRKYKRIVANTPREAEVALSIIGDLPDNCDGKTLDITTAKRRAKRSRKERQREQRGQPIESLDGGDIQLFHCRFQDLEQVANIAPESVNLIFTDIPYSREFAESGQVEDLAALADHVLVPGGVFVTYSGKYSALTVLKCLEKHLRYRWMGASVWEGNANYCAELGLLSRWKPLLIFSKGDWLRRGRWTDVSQVNHQEKDWHEWQQPLEEVEQWIIKFSRPGDLVIDPCGGGFTTAIACMRQNRRFIGCDVEQRCVEAGLRRLAEEKASRDGAA